MIPAAGNRGRRRGFESGRRRGWLFDKKALHRGPPGVLEGSAQAEVSGRHQASAGDVRDSHVADVSGQRAGEHWRGQQGGWVCEPMMTQALGLDQSIRRCRFTVQELLLNMFRTRAISLNACCALSHSRVTRASASTGMWLVTTRRQSRWDWKKTTWLTWRCESGRAGTRCEEARRCVACVGLHESEVL